MSTTYTLRYRDGIGRWNIGYIYACGLPDAMALAVSRYGAYRDLHMVQSCCSTH